MNLTRATLFTLAAVGAAAIAGAYMLGRHQAPNGAIQAAGNDAHAAPGAAPADSQGSMPEVRQAREGKVAPDANEAFTQFRVGDKNVKSIFADGKVVWSATSGGVIRYDTQTMQYRLYDISDGLLSKGIFFVGKIKGRIAVGTYGGGLSLLQESTGHWDNFNVPEGLGDAFVYDVLETGNGDLWIATWSGANRVRGGVLGDRSKWELYTVENTGNGLPNDWVYGLAEGRNGDIWFATEGGLARLSDGRWQNWNHEQGLGAPFEKVKNDIAFKSDPSRQSLHHAQQKQEMGLQDVDVAYNPNYIIAMKVDRDGVVWAGTWGGGLARFDGRNWTNYTTAEGLPGNHVFMLHIDAEQRLWIGTNNGLALFDKGRFKVATVADGLVTNAVFSMASAADGTKWIGGFGGVTHLRRAAILK